MHRLPFSRRVLSVVADHSVPLHYRLAVGIVFITAGTLLAKIAVYFPVLECIGTGCEAVGYLIHGAGCIPFLDWLFIEKEA